MSNKIPELNTYLLMVIGTSKKLYLKNLTNNMMENWSTGKQEWSAENEVQQEQWQGVCRRVSNPV